MDQNSNTRPALERAIWHFWSANWHKFEPLPEGTWVEIKKKSFSIFFRDKAAS